MWLWTFQRLAWDCFPVIWRIKSCGESFKVFWGEFYSSSGPVEPGRIAEENQGSSLGFSIPFDKKTPTFFFRSCSPGQQDQRLVLQKSYAFYVRDISSLCVLTLPTAPTACPFTLTGCAEDNSSQAIWVSPRTLKKTQSDSETAATTKP